jgi:hypothetical protein
LGSGGKVSEILWQKNIVGGWGKNTARPSYHAYNPSYSGGRDQEDSGSKSTPHKQFTRPYLKNTQHKKEMVEWFNW